MNLPKAKTKSDTDQRGLAPRIIDELFDSIDRASDDLEFTVKVSLFEIYMERVNDLLDPIKINLQVKEEKGGRGFFVADLTEFYVASDAEVYNILKLGNKNRRISSTSMNTDSSRSHSILSLTITQRSIVTSQTISSKFYIVDLAGSEKVFKTAASGIRLEEAKSINQSLTTLGKVINALTEKNQGHVPYRESKLTKLLQDSLGGNSRTTLLINCSPCGWNEEETLSTLRFGLSAKSIKNKPKVNLEVGADEIRRRLKESLDRIQELELLNTRLEDELATLRDGVFTTQDINNHLSQSLLDDLQQTKEEVANLRIDNEAHEVREELNQRLYREKTRDMLLEIQSLRQQVFKLIQQNSKLQKDLKVESKMSEDRFEGDLGDEVVLLGDNVFSPDDSEKQELRQYIQLLENENRLLRDELESPNVEDAAWKKLRSPLSSPSNANTSTCSNRSQKLIVPLRAGFKKMKQSLNNDTEMLDDLDDDELIEDGSVEVILKCGNVKVLHYHMKGSERRYVWKDRWLVLPQQGAFMKCYKQIKSLKPLEISLEKCEIQEHRLLKGDESPCFSIKTKEQRVFVVKVSTENERQEWISYLHSAMKRAQKISVN